MPYKEKRPLLRRMGIGLSNEILTFLKVSPFRFLKGGGVFAFKSRKALQD